MGAGRNLTAGEIVGPEGGISPEELEQFESAGAQRIQCLCPILQPRHVPPQPGKVDVLQLRRGRVIAPRRLKPVPRFVIEPAQEAGGIICVAGGVESGGRRGEGIGMPAQVDLQTAHVDRLPALRQFACQKRLGLGAVAELPAAPCLSSRIQYGLAVTPERLRRVIDLTHAAMKGLGKAKPKIAIAALAPTPCTVIRSLCHSFSSIVGKPKS